MERQPSVTKRADAIANRIRIIEAALAIFAESGLDLEVGAIVARAHVGVGTLYRHFSGRDDIVRAIVLHALDDTFGQLRLAVDGAGDDPRAALLAFVSTGLTVQRQYGPLFDVIRDPRMAKIFNQDETQSFRDRYLDVVFAVLQRGIALGVFSSDLDLDIVAATIMGSIMAVRDLYGSRWSLAELAQKLVRLQLAMLGDT